MSDQTNRYNDHWWRHLVVWLAVCVAVLPPLYVVTAAFNADQTLSGSSLIPRALTLENFKGLSCRRRRAEVFSFAGSDLR